jgi:hypothetical protein
MRNGSYLKQKKTMTTLLSQIIEENMETIVSMKLEANENQFVYMAKDGAIKYGHIDQYGQNILHAFGGRERSRREAISDLRFIVESEPES